MYHVLVGLWEGVIWWVLLVEFLWVCGLCWVDWSVYGLCLVSELQRGDLFCEIEIIITNNVMTWSEGVDMGLAWIG